LAQDILAVAEGCEVHLIHNINTSTGLATSASGTVVRVIYNNADVSPLLSGEHPVPYCIIVSFKGFQGFIVKCYHSIRRVFPFPNQRTWVPIFQKKFSVSTSYLPRWLAKKNRKVTRITESNFQLILQVTLLHTECRNKQWLTVWYLLTWD